MADKLHLDWLKRLINGNSISDGAMRELHRIGLVSHQSEVWGLGATNMGRRETLTLTDLGRRALHEADSQRGEAGDGR